ncbi:MAG: hypothetical protein JSV38_01275, partial [Desulfobacterales bacterium]
THFCSRLKWVMGFDGILPKRDVHDAEQHGKIDTIGGNLKVKVKKAVKGHGYQAAQCANGHEKPKRVI